MEIANVVQVTQLMELVQGMAMMDLASTSTELCVMKLPVLKLPVLHALLLRATPVSMKLALLVSILHVRGVVPGPLQILEPVLGQQRVHLAPLVRIHCLPPLRRVRPVAP